MKDQTRIPGRGFLRALCAAVVAVVLLTTSLSAQGRSNETKPKKSGYEAETITATTPGRNLTGPRTGHPRAIALEYARQQKETLDLTDDDLSDLRVQDEYTSEHSGITHIYMRQQIDGIDVVDAQLGAHVNRKGEIVALDSSLLRNVKAKANPGHLKLTAVEAVQAAASYLELEMTQPLEVIEASSGVQRETTLSTGGISIDPIQARLVFQPVNRNKVRLAWSVEIAEISGEHWWSVSVDAQNGDVLAHYDYTDHDNWGDAPAPDATRNALLAFSAATSSSHIGPPATFNDGSAYNVFAVPLESPNDGADSWVTNPADILGSPLGWHDTGTTKYQITRGNNVHSYLDVDANNSPDTNSTANSQAEPNGGAALQFNFPFNAALGPRPNQAAAVVNLFYWNNIVHDVFYRYGFTEAAGNFQVNNFGKGGAGNDDVRAEAQDGSGTNNANFSTPADNGNANGTSRPRMQMYVWTPPFSNVVIVNQPSPIAGTYTASSAAFGPALTAAGRTGDVVLGVPAEACTALSNAALATGKIVIVDRGTCPFVDKVKNAQNAGAIAVIVANNLDGDPIILGGTDNTITIPSVMVTLEHGNIYKANLPFNATLSVNPAPPPNRDSDFDAGVIVHEYGHGISNRLTGGRTTVSCLGNAEQMGEGWSDFIGLVLTTSPSDTATTPRGIGTYVSFQGPNGRGIRPTPYTTDMSINPSTYDSLKDTVGISQPHGIGYVWATMLWEMYWNLVEKHGYNPNVYEAWHTGGNNLAIQLVMDGMKLQPCSPGFVTGRNAILQADVNLTGGANQCEIWRAFAKRGLGMGASQGSSNNRTDGVQSFALPNSCTPTALLLLSASGECEEAATLSATLTRGVTPLAGKTIAFTVNGGVFSGNTAVTNASGVASVSVGLGSLPVGQHAIAATFAGDNDGLASAGSAGLTIADTIAPVIDCPSNVVTVTDPGAATALVTFSATAADSCSTVDVTTSHPSGFAFPVGTTTVSVTAIDAQGNVAVCSFTVTVSDDQAPALTLPDSIVTEFTSEAGATVSYVATATDNASAVTPVCAPASGSVFAIGTTSVSCTAIDAAGNSTTATFTVTVQGARSVMQNVLSDLQALRGSIGSAPAGVTATTIDPKALDRAIADLVEALTPSFWVDDLHLTLSNGDRVFQSGKNAVNVLTNLAARDSAAAASLQGPIDRLMATFRLLATVAINESAGDVKALDRRAKGDTFAGAGQYEAAIEQYRTAWSFAMKLS